MIYMIEWLDVLSRIAISAWIVATIPLSWHKTFGLPLAEKTHAVARWIYLEIKPFFLYSLAFDVVQDALRGPLTWWDYLGLGLGIFFYLTNRNLDDDDRWKRRKQKLKELVQVADGKLVVVPSPNR